MNADSPEIRQAIRKVMIHHKLTKVGDGVIEADIAHAVFDELNKHYKSVSPDDKKDKDGNFNTGDDQIDLLLGLTEDMVLGNANMDTGIHWIETLNKLKQRLKVK